MQNLLIDINTLKQSKTLFDFSPLNPKSKRYDSKSGLLIDLSLKPEVNQLKKSKTMNNDLYTKPDDDEIKKNRDLLKIRRENNEVFIVPPPPSTSQNMIWRVLSKDSKEYLLQENDVIRMGCGSFKVLYINFIKLINGGVGHYSNNSMSYSKSSSFFNINSHMDRAFVMGDGQRIQTICRYCNTDEISINNILIRPCDCKSYIHLQCYKTFLKKKMKAEYIDNSRVIIDNSSLICDRCMGKERIVMNLCNAKKDLLDLQCFTLYVILEKNDGNTVIVNLERHKDIFIVIL